jgi:hypothetical protein
MARIVKQVPPQRTEIQQAIRDPHKAVLDQRALKARPVRVARSAQTLTTYDSRKEIDLAVGERLRK